MSSEFRRRPRRALTQTILVTDTMTGRDVGRIGNLSETGMLLIANVPLVVDALYQFGFELTWEDGKTAAFEIGARLLWLDPSASADRVWTGFRFLAIPADQIESLRSWIKQDPTAA